MTDAVLNLKGRRHIGGRTSTASQQFFSTRHFIIPCVQDLGHSGFTVDRNTTTVIRVTDGYNASLVSFSRGIAVATFTFIALAIIPLPPSLPVGFFFFSIHRQCDHFYYLIKVVLIFNFFIFIFFVSLVFRICGSFLFVY